MDCSPQVDIPPVILLTGRDTATLSVLLNHGEARGMSHQIRGGQVDRLFSRRLKGGQYGECEVKNAHCKHEEDNL